MFDENEKEVQTNSVMDTELCYGAAPDTCHGIGQ